VQHSTESPRPLGFGRRGELHAGDRAFGTADPLAIVASGTRNALAICAVVSPPTARNVSATCDGGDSTGWQHRNSRVSVSSWAVWSTSAAAAVSSAPSSAAAVVSRRLRALSLRH